MRALGIHNTCLPRQWQSHLTAISLVLELLLCFGSPKVQAQVTTAEVVGTVVDNTEAVIPGAPVRLENLGTHEVRNTQSTDTGDFVFTLLNPGVYSLTVTANGFKTFSVATISLSSGDRPRYHAKMVLGAAAETVEVVGASSALQSDSSVLGTTITNKAVEDLPLNGRNFINIAQIAPGANEAPPNGPA